MSQFIFPVSYENLSTLDVSDKIGRYISVRINESDPDTQIALLEVQSDKHLKHFEVYVSPVELATVSTKQMLTIYAKRKITQKYNKWFSKDDPRLHSYLSKLGYEGIKHVCNNLDQFAEEFHKGDVKMSIPGKWSKAKSK